MRQATTRPRRSRKNLTTAGTARNRGVPVARTNLTPAEKALLPDPSRVTQDDADAIVGLRRARTEKPIPLEKVLKRYGYRMEG